MTKPIKLSNALLGKVLTALEMFRFEIAVWGKSINGSGFEGADLSISHETHKLPLNCQSGRRGRIFHGRTGYPQFCALSQQIPDRLLNKWEPKPKTCSPEKARDNPLPFQEDRREFTVDEL